MKKAFITLAVLFAMVTFLAGCENQGLGNFLVIKKERTGPADVQTFLTVTNGVDTLSRVFAAEKTFLQVVPGKDSIYLNIDGGGDYYATPPAPSK